MFDINLNVFGERLREERERLGYSQKELSALCAVQPLTQGNYENGVRKPDAAYLYAAMKLGVDLMYLFSGTREGEVPDSKLDTAATTIGSRLMRERARLGFAESAIADLLGLSIRTYCRYESGGEIPSGILAKLAELGGDVQYILTGRTGTVTGAGASNMVVPDELQPLFNAWLNLWLCRTVDAEMLMLWTAIVDKMNPAHVRPSENRIAKANAALEQHRTELNASGDVGAVVPGVFSRRPGIKS